MNHLSPEAKKLFSLARSVDEPQAEVLRRVETSLVARIASGAAMASVTTTTTQAAASLGTSLPWAKLTVLAGVAVSLGGAGYWRLQVSAQEPRPSAANASEARPMVREPAIPMQAATPEPAADATTPADAVEPPAAARIARRNRSAAVGSAESPAALADPLQAELRDLRLAQQALRNGDADRVLALLDEQDRTYARGAMQEERAAAKVLALCQLGQVAPARSAAQRFELRWPKSSLLARLKNSCWRP